MYSLYVPSVNAEDWVYVPSVAAEDCEGPDKDSSGWCTKPSKRFTNKTDEEFIESIVGHIRNGVMHDFLKAFGEKLDMRLESIIERGAVRLWNMEPAERDAYLVNKALFAWTSKIQVLVEISCTRSPEEFLNASEAYRARYKRSIEEDVAVRTSGDICKLLVPLVSSYRYGGDDVDMTLAESEAKLMHSKLSEKDYACDDIITILTTRSKAQIQETLNQYKNLFGNDMKKDLKGDMEDKFLWILRVTLRCLVCPDKYFKKLIRLWIKDMVRVEFGGKSKCTAKEIWRNDEDALARVVATCADFGMNNIKDENPKMLLAAGHGYHKMILALIGHQEAV